MEKIVIPNHKCCKNCWWWIKGSLGFGRCYRHNSDEERYSMTEENDYCPYYLNSKKG